ncbi:colicin uptake protein TolQ [Aquisphaera giovannonii]|uniref:Colicin uptake protein TolQ n=1 Tax=Aquisphaera giovannonii TaxID=406548 RepID=A0A5B9W5U4_9BACT|nr:MotA/TolQ/ExbB proton channel family protein [Aquisphaera giovannonii]QEH35509.1 colicin uptake protein TolQ [Aquisphaera giovannonii]
MNLTIRIIDSFGYAIYGALALLAVWGVYNGILLYRTLRKKTLADPRPLISQVQELCQARKFDAAIAVCQSPAYWHKALAQLIAVALQNRDKGLAKIRQLLVTEFHTEVIAGMENRLASISTIVRMGPLLGLLGTVASMIAAFSRIGGAEQVNPRQLASDISLALWATGSGLLIANPMMLIGNDVHARLRRLRDRTERQLQDVIEILEPADPAAPTHGVPAAPPPARGGRHEPGPSRTGYPR